MPLYEYRCTTCGHRFEKIQSFSAPEQLACPKCGNMGERLISAPAIQFKGSGFYLTDYGKAGSSKGGASETGGAGSDSNSSSESKPSGTGDSSGSSTTPATSSTPASSTSSAASSGSSGSTSSSS